MKKERGFPFPNTHYSPPADDGRVSMVSIDQIECSGFTQTGGQEVIEGSNDAIDSVERSQSIIDCLTFLFPFLDEVSRAHLFFDHDSFLSIA